MIFLCRGKTWLLGVLVALLMIFDGPLSAADQKSVVENQLGMIFVLIPAGTFVMGSPIEEAHRNVSEVQHQVTISEPFYLQRTEVTVDQWRSVMGRRWLARKRGTGDMPVVRVSWNDCQKFIRKLNRLTGEQYLLPTEAQWEYAARARSSTAYFWGNKIDCSRAMYANNPMKHDDCVGAFSRAGTKSGQPAPVGSFAPNAWGLYDMHGNVWEWCEDLFDSYEAVSTVDPCETESGRDRVRRGGSWFSAGSACRSANRAYAHPMSRFQNTGFRLVMVPSNRNRASSDSQ
ncbi:hypothetical protein DSCW_37710 [Desulfosarcina widdelii]|uniref:Sulfatase-modifying factor enzyme-like domain-containing protein n=1 Tax=Desulfosarcina widdelii TaxID=947919 RepID=A0A5K7ZD20_9BACT|nr:formylglycine-generating enzyme family protein [Desulfosarcina widdelii]BBO76354.1 hypothetical protein DSCW_37710 [Desulfosarcina widdelii]